MAPPRAGLPSATVFIAWSSSVVNISGVKREATMQTPGGAVRIPEALSAPSGRPPAPESTRQPEAVWAESSDDVRRAQRLRYRVFVSELGAQPSVPRGTPAGHDADRFDDFCAHLLVRTVATGQEASEVVGTYRVLTPEAARRAGGFYSETEFDLRRLESLHPRMAELGRSCIDPAWRTGGTILILWSALGCFMVRHRLDVAFGCASVSLGDGGHRAASLWRRLSALHLAPPERQVTPLRPFSLGSLRDDVEVVTPALIKGYLRCGAELLGPPAWDADFRSADLPMLMTLAGLPQRHRRHFLGSRLAEEVS